MTNIEWTDATWSPVTGCTKVSAGCRNCYAETVADRFWGKQYGTVDGERRRFTDVWTHPERLDEPLRWRKPRRVFVNSMSDLFHEAVPDEFIDRVFAVMAISNYVGRCRARDCQHEPCESVDKPLAHSFQVLTKRPDRMRVYVRTPGRIDAVAEAAGMLGNWYIGDGALDAMSWPLPNVWLGVSAENQETADERIPILLDTPAAVRFVSAEPLLGPIDLLSVTFPHARMNVLEGVGVATRGVVGQSMPNAFSNKLDWIITGGESGPRARPCDVVWIRGIVEQCKAANVACFVKQLGSFSTHAVEVGRFTGSEEHPEKHRNRHMASKGCDPSEWPVDLCVREFPA